MTSENYAAYKDGASEQVLFGILPKFLSLRCQVNTSRTTCARVRLILRLTVPDTSTSDGEAPASESPAILTKQLAAAPKNLPGPPTLVTLQQVWGKQTTALNLARVVLPVQLFASDRAETVTANVGSCHSFVFHCRLTV